MRDRYVVFIKDARLVGFCSVLAVAVGCAHTSRASLQAADTTRPAGQMGPLVVTRRPSVDTPEYYVELKPEFSQWKCATAIAMRVGGKVGYIYKNFHGFSVHSIPDSMAVKLRAMPEVLSVTKSTWMTLD